MDYLELYNRISEELDELDLCSFNGIQLSKLLAFPVSQLAFNKRIGIIESLKRIIGQLVFDSSFQILCCGGENLFIISHRYLERSDHKEIIEYIASTTKNHDIIYPNKNRVLSLYGLKYIFRLFQWYRRVRKCKSVNKRDAIGIVSYLLTAARYANCFFRLFDVSAYKTVTVRMDGQLLDNILVQNLHNRNITTITIQDGYEVKAPKQINATWQLQAKLRGSVSSYFLVWSEYFKEIIEQVISHDQKVIPLGMPNIEIDAEDCIGVLLDATSTENSNIRMISIIKDFCNKNNMRYRLRYHPSDKVPVYNDYLDDRVMTSDSDTDSLQTFIMKCKYIVGCNSTSILEAAFLNTHTYRMIPQNCVDILSDCNYPNSFTNEDELNRMIYSNIVIDPEYVDRVCGSNDVARNYCDFYSGLN